MGIFKKRKKNILKISVENGFFGPCIFEKEENKSLVNLVDGIGKTKFGRYEVTVEIEVDEDSVIMALAELEKLYRNADAILEKIYPEAMEQCNDWEEEDALGNPISLDYIKKYYELTDISVAGDIEDGFYITLIGSVGDEDGGELLGDHSFVAEVECSTGEITYDLWG